MIKAGVIGATGYAGVELVRILAAHPSVKVESISSVSFEGQELADIYPAMINLSLPTLTDSSAVINNSDVIFASLPHGLSQELAEEAIGKGKIFIDLGADFRLDSEDEYKKWYGGDFLNKPLHDTKVYGLPELFRDKIKTTRLIANPGCYPTGATLALAPFVSRYDFLGDSIIIDAKSGVTGAGRGLSDLTHYPNINDNFTPYKIASHRHTPEIEQNIKLLSKKDVKLLFTPHLLPVNRGILSTVYISPKADLNIAEVHHAYTDFYGGEEFVKVLKLGDYASIRPVAYSNYCHISLHKDDNTGRIIIVSAIDNMVKGAAGQAVQNMNIILGIDETTALKQIAPSF